MINTALSTVVEDMGGAFSAQRLALAGQMTLIGMGMVFSVLVILWAVLAIFKLIFAKPAVPKKTEAPVASAPASVAEPELTVSATSDDELVAVITAAVAAYIAGEEPDAFPSGFRVVSFRRANGGRAWNAK